MFREVSITLLKKFRRDLHEIPELSLEEHETAKYIKTILDVHKIKYEEIIGTGVLVYFEGKSNRTIAFRTDIDALPIQEKNEFYFKSKNKNNMHACGHDGHTSNMLLFTIYLSNINLNTIVVIIFQPAEEKYGGANRIIKSKVLDKYNIEAFYGLHLAPDIDFGFVASKSNEMMAMSTEFEISILGKSSHAGTPHMGQDSIIAAVNLISQYQLIISRLTSPLEKRLINIGKINAGNASNIVCDQANIGGTIRAFNKNVFDDIIKAIENINLGIEKSFNVKVIFKTITEPYLPVINDEQLFNKIKTLINDDINFIELKDPYMLSEDFSFYQDYKKGLFFYLGTKTNEKNASLHNEKFDFDEEVLYEGFKLFKNILENYEHEKL